MTIDRVERTVATEGPVAEEQPGVHLDGPHLGGMFPALAVGRHLALVGLAVLAILVLLPAVIAAQAASAL